MRPEFIEELFENKLPKRIKAYEKNTQITIQGDLPYVAEIMDEVDDLTDVPHWTITQECVLQ
jgi:hypothetical protein